MMSYLTFIAPDGTVELSTAPIPQGPKLPEPTAALILVDCVDCQGDSKCDTCGSTGLIEVCGSCLEKPQVIAGNETCGCTFPGTQACNTLSPCEFCGTLHPGSTLIFGSCTTCFDEAHERYKAEMGEDGLRF